MFAFALMFLGENFLKPVRLVFRASVVRDRGLVKDHKFLAASVAPKRTHFPKAGCPLPCLTLFDCDRFHR